MLHPSSTMHPLPAHAHIHTHWTNTVQPTVVWSFLLLLILGYSFRLHLWIPGFGPFKAPLSLTKALVVIAISNIILIYSLAVLSPLLHTPGAMFRPTYRLIDWIVYVREGQCGSVLLLFKVCRATGQQQWLVVRSYTHFPSTHCSGNNITGNSATIKSNLAFIYHSYWSTRSLFYRLWAKESFKNDISERLSLSAVAFDLRCSLSSLSFMFWFPSPQTSLAHRPH